jgi:RNA polymerase sigma-70 factor, ECF subfamily
MDSSSKPSLEQSSTAERELVRGLQSSDRTVRDAAFRSLMRQHQRRIYALAYDMTGNRDDAHDLAQEVFCKAFVNIHNFQGASKVATWLHRLTINAALDLKRSAAYRASRTSTELHEDQWHGSAPLPDALADAAFLEAQIQQALQALSPQQRAVFVLRHYHDEKITDIATTLGVADGTVKTLLHRATQTMRDELRAAGGHQFSTNLNVTNTQENQP